MRQPSLLTCAAVRAHHADDALCIAALFAGREQNILAALDHNMIKPIKLAALAKKTSR